MEVGYPEREKFFAQRFIRLITKLCLAQEVGAMGCYLLTTVVCQEDACRYRKPVTYYDTQLMPLLGCRSKSKFLRMKKSLVSAGWLHFQAGKKGVASKYWVLIPPEYSEVEDAPVCETEHDLAPYTEPNRGQIGGERGADEGQIRGGSGVDEGHSLPYSPFPIPSSPYPIGGEEENETEIAASMANEFWFRIPGSYRPPLQEVGLAFASKLRSLKAAGRDETEKIWATIRDPTRDPNDVRTLNQMWKFWEQCGIEEKKSASQRKQPDGHYTGLEAPVI